MKIKILFFGVTRDIIEDNCIEIELTLGTSVMDLQQILKKKYSGLNDIENFAVAVNEEYANGEYAINKNYVIAIIPPVSGGWINETMKKWDNEWIS